MCFKIFNTIYYSKFLFRSIHLNKLKFSFQQSGGTRDDKSRASKAIQRSMPWVLLSIYDKCFHYSQSFVYSRIFVLLIIDYSTKRGARWLSGRVSDSGARGPGFETYRRRVVSLSKTLYSPKELVNYPGSDGSVPIWLKNCWLGR